MFKVPGSIPSPVKGGEPHFNYILSVPISLSYQSCSLYPAPALQLSLY